MRYTMKFGGTSVSDGERIIKVASIISSYVNEHDIVVVVSAMAGVTDSLIEISQLLIKGKKDVDYIASIRDFIAQLEKRHAEAAKVSIKDKKLLDEVLIEIHELIKELERVLTGVHFLGELSNRSLDYIMSFGERLSAPILAYSLRDLGINAKNFTGSEIGIVTNSDFGKARPIIHTTKRLIKERIETIMKEGIVPVVTGFIAADTNGALTTIGRGGSDLTASILGVSIKADEIWIWTDVDGIMTCDPKLVPEAKTIPVISYLEACELAFFGAKVLYPKTLEPAIEEEVPVRVMNTFNPEGSGTLIVKEQEKYDEIVKALSSVQNASLLTVSGVGIGGAPRVAASIFSALSQENITVIMFSQGSSETNISLVVLENELERAVKALYKEFDRSDNVIKEIIYDEDVCVIAVVGVGMRGTPGVAARVFNAVAKQGVNIIMISQGSSEVNISFLISREDAKKAVEALHEEFNLGRTETIKTC